MRIGLVVPGGFDRSGTERVVPVLLWLVERLARRHDVHVFVLDYYPEPCTYSLAGATIHDLGRVTSLIRLRRAAMARRLRAALSQHGPFDVLHAYWGMPAGAVAIRAAAKTPLVVTFSSGELVAIDDIGYGLQRRRIDRGEVARIVHEAAAVVVPTSYMARQPPLEGVTPLVIPVGIDTSAFRPIQRQEGPPWRLIRVGSINRVKDHTTLLHAIAKLPDDVHVDVVGEDTLNGAMQALAQTLGVAARVTFHGWLPTSALAPLYARAHLNIVSSRHEASSVTMLEAACAGVPTVGSDVGYVADWQPDRAVAVPVRDPAALAGAVAALLADAPRRAQIAAAARQWTLEHDADWTARAIEDVYVRVAQDARTPGS